LGECILCGREGNKTEYYYPDGRETEIILCRFHKGNYMAHGIKRLDAILNTDASAIPQDGSGSEGELCCGDCDFYSAGLCDNPKNYPEGAPRTGVIFEPEVKPCKVAQFTKRTAESQNCKAEVVGKSGEFKGRFSSRWVRGNTGVTFFICPKCNVEFYSTKPECKCGVWERNRAGFRYRLIAPMDASAIPQDGQIAEAE
jgi:hypothetical protein